MIFVSVFGVFSVYFSVEFRVCWFRYVVGFVGCGGWDFILGLFGVSFLPGILVLVVWLLLGFVSCRFVSYDTSRGGFL